MRRRISGITPGRISSTSGSTFRRSRARFSSAIESMTNTRRTVNSPSSFARRTSAGRVEMIPPARVVFAIKSTAMSRGLRPFTRSRCTTGNFPASRTRSVSSATFRRSPNSRNTTSHSDRSAFSNCASFLTAAMTGHSASSGLFIPHAPPNRGSGRQPYASRAGAFPAAPRPFPA